MAAKVKMVDRAVQHSKLVELYQGVVDLVGAEETSWREGSCEVVVYSGQYWEAAAIFHLWEVEEEEPVLIGLEVTHDRAHRTSYIDYRLTA